MPKLIYGTAWKAERTSELVERAVLAGFRGIDTACQPKHYNEAGVGDALERLGKKGVARDALFLQTKFTSIDGQDPNRLPYDRAAPLEKQVEQSFAASLKNLRTDRLDSWVLHSPLRTFDQTMTAWRAMERLQQAGGTRWLGISNCYDLAFLKELHQAARVKPAVVQNRFYEDTGYDAALRRWCKEGGLRYQSFWTLTGNPQILRHPALQAVAAGLGKTPAQIWFRFLVEQDVVPLTGTCSDRHMTEDLEALTFELPRESVAALARLLD